MYTLGTVNAKYFTSPSGDSQNEWAIQMKKYHDLSYYLMATWLH